MSEAVLLVGGGGREHVLAEEMAASSDLDSIYCAPGNAGTAAMAKAENLPFSATDIDSIVGFARQHDEQLTVVVGPEAPLVAGLADALRAEDITVFGPNANAARLEGSKLFACRFMEKYGIPQPDFEAATTMREALAALGCRDARSVVLKADGLAGGKGVVLPASGLELYNTLKMMLSGEGFDGAGRDGLVIQERLSGPEVSAFVICDGSTYSVMPFFAQDHKRRDDGDRGPNTGGMGAYTPVPAGLLSQRQLTLIDDIAGRTVSGMAAEGTPYQGVLYLGLMLADEYDGDPVVIEYNCRFGDPETQVVLPSLAASGTDIYGMLRETALGEVPDLGRPQLAGRAALTVCLAAGGYPESPRKGAVVNGLDREYTTVKTYHGSTKQAGGDVVAAGGRVLYVTGQGKSVDAAAAAAYAAIGDNGINFDGIHYRTDIGHRARTSAAR